MEVFELASETDYRRAKIAGSPVWFTRDPAGFDRLWDELRDGEESPETVTVKGRAIAFPRTADGMARATFAALCERPLGAGDYLAVAKRFHTLFLEDVPVLAHSDRNAAKRMITLIDALYEARRRLVVLAAAEPDGLYPVAHGTEAFEFRRTVSRLVEMRGEDWPGDAGRATLADRAS